MMSSLSKLKLVFRVQKSKPLPPSSKTSQPATPQFWLLAGFLVILFLTGGASRIDAQSLIILRPLSVVMCAAALLTIRRQHFAERKWLWAGFASMALLCLLHLIPLPPVLWQSLPGREIVMEVDRVAGLGDVWRPLTLTPMTGWHALAALIIPLAVLMLGAQLTKDDLYRLLPVILALGVLSGLIGVLQILGDPRGSLYFYRITNNGAAVGLFANRNHAAVLLACLFPMLAVYASSVGDRDDKAKGRQLTAIAVGFVLVPLILVTGSRAGLIVTVPALIAAALLFSQLDQNSTRKKSPGFGLKRTHIMAATAVISLAFLTMYFARAEALERLFEQSAMEDARRDYWEIGLKMASDFFPFGSGSGSFVETYQMYEPLAYLIPTYANHMHNDWLELWLTMGLPGAVLTLAATAAFAVRSFWLWRQKNGNRRAVRYARMASIVLIIIAFASFGDYPLRTPIMLSLFALCTLWLTSPALSGKTAITDFNRGQ
jgi:O-antigen ligase